MGRTIKWSIGIGNEEYEGTFEADDGMDDDEIEEMAKKEAFGCVYWTWWDDTDELRSCSAKCGTCKHWSRCGHDHRCACDGSDLCADLTASDCTCDAWAPKY